MADRNPIVSAWIICLELADNSSICGDVYGRDYQGTSTLLVFEKICLA